MTHTQIKRSSEEPRAGAPRPNSQISAQHAAQVSEVGHALLSARDAQKQLERAIKRDKEPCRHRDRRKNEHDHAAREIQPEREEQPEDPARCADGRIRRPVGNTGDRELRDGRTDDADEIVDREAPGPKTRSISEPNM